MTAHADHGSLGEEAARLFEALQDTAARWQGGGRREDGGHGHTDTPAACRVCPVCQVIGAVQSVRPETVQHLADAAVSLTAALSDVLSGMAARSAPRERPDEARPGEPRPRQPTDTVQHIDITD